MNTHSLPRAGPAYTNPLGRAPFRIAQTLCRFAMTSLFDLTIYGADRVPRTGGVLLASNHQSFLDPVLLGLGLPRPLSYMAKSELFEAHPVFAKLIRARGAFPVRQTGSAAGAIKETIDRLQEGHALNIYPEGSRTETGELMPFLNGIALVVRKAKVPVVPAAITGSFEAWPTGTKSPQIGGRLRVMFGHPLALHDLKPNDMMALLRQEIGRMFAELRALDPTLEPRRLRGVEKVKAAEARKARKTRRKHGAVET